MSSRPEPRTSGNLWPCWLVTEDYLVEALQDLQPWRVVGDSLDWDLAVFAYDVAADTIVMGVVISAGLYTQEVTGDGRHVIAHRWTDRTALIELLNTVDQRHYMFEHIAHASPRFVAAHQTAIHADADRVLALIERDERDGGPLHDAPVRCWDDLGRYVDGYDYLERLPRSGVAAYRDDDDRESAVIDRVDTLLHQRDRVLSFDESEAAGFDATLRDGSPPHTWASLTPCQRAAAGLEPQPAAERAARPAE